MTDDVDAVGAAGDPRGADGPGSEPSAGSFTGSSAGSSADAASRSSRVAGVVLSVDPASAQAPFRQLKDQIVEAVRRGALTTGTRLPTVRGLAEDVGISTATAAKVYRELEDAGVLEGRGRAGTFVAAADNSEATLTAAAEDFVARAADAGFRVDAALDAVREAFARHG